MQNCVLCEYQSFEPHIRFKALTLAYRVDLSTAPSYLNTLIHIYNPCLSQCSAKNRPLMTPTSHSKRPRVKFSRNILLSKCKQKCKFEKTEEPEESGLLSFGQQQPQRQISISIEPLMF